jgi:hypothetical protein
VIAALRAEYPAAAVVGYSATGGTGLPDLLGAWDGPAGNSEVALEVDYDRYAAAEAELAWLNQELHLRADGEGFDLTGWARTVLEDLSAWSRANDAEVGHAKITVEAGPEQYAKLSLTGAGATPTVDRTAAPAASARVVVNARVACEPEVLDARIASAVAAASAAYAVTATTTPAESFKPGYPRPVHRLAAAV